MDAVQWRDYPMIQGTMLFVAGVFVVVNTGTDLLYGVVGPPDSAVGESRS